MSPDEIISVIVDAAGASGIPVALALAVCKAESNFDPNAESPEGAVGLFQLLPATAIELGATDPFDPRLNARGGCRYLKEMIVRFGGNLLAAIAAYNWGPGNVQRAIAIQGEDGWLLDLPHETRLYVQKVLSGFYAGSLP